MMVWWFTTGALYPFWAPGFLCYPAADFVALENNEEVDAGAGQM